MTGRKRRTILFTLVAVIGVAGLGGLALSGASGELRVEELPPLGGEGVSPDVDQALAAVDDRAKRDFPNTYAGLFVTNGVVYVGFTDAPSSNAQRLFRGEGGSFETQAFLADYSLRVLTEIADSISRDTERWRREGIRTSLVSVDIHSNRVRISLMTDGESARAALRAEYGDAIIFGQPGALFTK